MSRRALQTTAGVFACIAVVASPCVARLPIPGVPLTITDAALALAALCLLTWSLPHVLGATFKRNEVREKLVGAGLCIPSSKGCAFTHKLRSFLTPLEGGTQDFLRRWESEPLRRHLAGPLWLLGACVLSAASATDSITALRETFQIGLYIILGSVVFCLLDGRRWRWALRWALRGAMALGLALSLGALMAPGAFASCLPPWPTFAAYLITLACLTMALGPRRGFLPVALAALAIALVTVAAHPVSANPPQTGPVPQQLREAYAALSILADRPLLGVGPGNYQTHIGEHYQGMPKDNTMTPGTGVGYGILVASVGMLGLAAYLEWLRRLWQATAQTQLRIPLLALMGAGFFTPIFVGPMLMLLALLGSLVRWPGRAQSIATLKPPGLPVMTGCVAGLIATMLLAVQPVPRDAFTLIWEAEGFAELEAPMSVQREVAGASGKSAVELALGSGQGWRGLGTGSVTYRVDMPRAGQYRLWARTLWKDGCTNAVFLSANNGPRLVFGNDAVFGAWHWVKGQQLVLDKGLNYLVFANHSDGIALDKLILTEDPLYAPAGLGDGISQFFDGFAGCDADNTGSWEFPSGRWRVLRAAGEGAGGVNDCLAQWNPEGGIALGGFAGWHDYDAKVRVMLPGAGTIGLVLFREREGTGLSVQCEVGEGETFFRLVKEDGGAPSVIAETQEAGSHTDRWIELGLRFEQGEAVGLVDGRPILRAPFGGPHRGQIALVSKGAAGSYFDNVNVTFRRR